MPAPPATDTTAVGVALAGGESRRMGRDKGALELRGETLVERASQPGSRREGQARPILRRHALRSRVSTSQSTGNDSVDVSYRLLLRNPARSTELQAELEETTGVERVALFLHENESEV